MQLWNRPFYVKPPVDYRKPGMVWKVKKYLYGDKRAPRGWARSPRNNNVEPGF